MSWGLRIFLLWLVILAVALYGFSRTDEWRRLRRPLGGYVIGLAWTGAAFLAAFEGHVWPWALVLGVMAEASFVWGLWPWRRRRSDTG